MCYFVLHFNTLKKVPSKSRGKIKAAFVKVALKGWWKKIILSWKKNKLKVGKIKLCRIYWQVKKKIDETLLNFK